MPFRTLSFNIQVEPGKPGRKFQKEKTIRQRKNLPIECVQGDQPAMPKPKFLCAPVFPWCVGGGDVRNHVMWCGEVRCGEMWRCDVVTSGEM